jgi:hypothetical protein
MRARYQPFIIFSAEHSDNTISRNAELTARLGSFLIANGIQYTKCIGHYKGTQETSFKLKESEKNKVIAELILAEYNQECYLNMSSEGRGYLVSQGGQTDFIGSLNILSDVENVDDFTYIPETYTAFNFRR